MVTSTRIDDLLDLLNERKGHIIELEARVAELEARERRFRGSIDGVLRGVTVGRVDRAALAREILRRVDGQGTP